MSSLLLVFINIVAVNFIIIVVSVVTNIVIMVVVAVVIFLSFCLCRVCVPLQPTMRASGGGMKGVCLSDTSHAHR